MDKLLKRTLNEKIRTQRYPSRSYYSLMAEKESIRLTARTGEFTRIVERATESSAAQPRAIIFWLHRISLLTAKNPTETSGFFGGEREIRTLEPFLTVTRFPVVRPRPTRRFLQKILNFTTLKLYLIYKALSNDISRNSAKYAWKRIKVSRRRKYRRKIPTHRCRRASGRRNRWNFRRVFRPFSKTVWKCT